MTALLPRQIETLRSVLGQVKDARKVDRCGSCHVLHLSHARLVIGRENKGNNLAAMGAR